MSPKGHTRFKCFCLTPINQSSPLIVQIPQLKRKCLISECNTSMVCTVYYLIKKKSETEEVVASETDREEKKLLNKVFLRI